MSKDYEYKIKKRKALKVETLPALEEEPRQTKSLTHTRYFIGKKKKERNCIICGQEAFYMAYFQMDKAQLLEKYCQKCLDKWVEIPTVNK